VLYLFDIDGTLIGGDGSGRRAFERACLEVLGVERSLADLKLDGMTDPLILDHVFATKVGRAAIAGEAEAVLSAYVRHLAGEVAAGLYHVKPAVDETLALLESRDAVVGLATGNIEAGARIKLTRGDLWRRFPFGGFGSDAGDRAELVRIAVARGRARAPRHVEDDEVFVIGDTPRDVLAAHAAGAVAVGVATGSHSVDELLAAGADVAHPTLREWMATL
jgi:phosphoglycolate phosphatase-like HAD superfamily hydrolase